MRRLTVFDGSDRIATITQIGNGSLFIFARSIREWKAMKRLVDSGYDVSKDDSKFLELVAARAHSYDYSTELIDDKYDK